MGRWQPDARARLQLAALALYGERGYEQTTVAEIAERAGLTKRTFFRYFTDKREVLFWGSELLERQMVAAIEAAPASASANPAADSFNRTVASGWGSAETGGWWTVVGSPWNWSVSPSRKP